MQPIQLISVIFGLFFLSRIILRYRDKGVVTVKEFIFWTLISGGLIVFGLDPDIAVWLSQPFGVGRPVDFIVYLSIILLFYLVFKIFVMLESIRRDITKLTRKISIDEAKRKNR